MQEKWQDLIPFYVAGTLPDKDKQALEAYLAQCGDPCHNEVEEWRAIASATWHHVNDKTSELPPLSQQVLAIVAQDAELRASGKVVTSKQFRAGDIDNPTNAPVYLRPTGQPDKKIRRNPRLPLTMVAAFMTMVIFGGILLRQVSLDDLEPQTQVIDLTDTLDIDGTEEFGAPAGIEPINPDSGIIGTPTSLAPQPTSTFPPTPTPLPTRVLELPPNSGGGLEDVSSIASLPQTGACTIRNDSQQVLTVYRDASFDAVPVGSFVQGAQAEIIITFNGWYQLSYGNWVFGGDVTVFGDCSQLWTATPTAIGGVSGSIDGIPDCVIRNNGTEPVPMYQWPDFNSPPNGRFSAGQVENIQIGANGWYQVFYAQWVYGGDVEVTGSDCNNLWIPTPTQNPIETSTPLPTPVIQFWSHVTTVTEHGCGGTVGEQETIQTQIQRAGDEVIVTYPATGTRFWLTGTGVNSFSGGYTTSASINIDLTFTSETTYIAKEIVTHESGCIVRLNWAGTRQ